MLYTCQRFGPDQLDALCRNGNLRGVKWTKETLMKALCIHFACGTSGYELVIETQMPLSCVRVLQDSVKHIKFAPGILYEIFKLLPGKTHSMLSIVEAEEFDPSTKNYIGRCTIPASKPKLKVKDKALFDFDEIRIEEYRNQVSISALTTKAKKAMIFILGGVAQRWKQVVAYHFTSNY